MHWLSVRQCIKFKLAMFKMSDQVADTAYLADDYEPVLYVNSRQLSMTIEFF